MADSLLVFVPHEHTHRASSILKQIGILNPAGSKARAVENVMKLIVNSLSAAKVTPIEMAREAGSNKSAMSTGKECDPNLSCTRSLVMLIGSS